MAIVINEENRNSKGGLFGMGVLILIFAILGFASYYIFFVKPQVIDSVVPSGLQSIQELSRLKFNPSEVLSGPFFTGQYQSIPLTTPITSGNAQPFGVL